MAKCGAPTKSGGRCQRQVVTNTGRCPIHQGTLTSYGVTQRKAKEAKAKMQKIRRRKKR